MKKKRGKRGNAGGVTIAYYLLMSSPARRKRLKQRGAGRMVQLNRE